MKPQPGDIWKFKLARREETYLIYEVTDTHRYKTYRVNALYIEGGFPVLLGSWNIEDGWEQMA